LVNFVYYFYFFFKKYIYFIHLNLVNNLFYIFLKKEFIIEFFMILKKSLFFKNNLLMELTACDFLLVNKRFLLYYNFLNIFFNLRLFIIFYFNDFVTFNLFRNYKSYVYSIVNIYFNANWLEREVWDMFGIFFLNHFDLRRILTDYGFMSFPLRKDYPLTGFFEVRYDDTLKIIVNEHIKLIQEFRVFSFINPWESNYNDVK
jgi:NADH:ubiquinone oxidoreductase subunit C